MAVVDSVRITFVPAASGMLSVLGLPGGPRHRQLHWTLPIALRSLRGDEEVGIGVLLAVAILAMLPSILAFLAFQRQFVRGLTSGAIKG